VFDCLENMSFFFHHHGVREKLPKDSSQIINSTPKTNSQIESNKQFTISSIDVFPQNIQLGQEKQRLKQFSILR
jgi:hypothetical protein